MNIIKIKALEYIFEKYKNKCDFNNIEEMKEYIIKYEYLLDDILTDNNIDYSLYNFLKDFAYYQNTSTKYHCHNYLTEKEKEEIKKEYEKIIQDCKNGN